MPNFRTFQGLIFLSFIFQDFVGTLQNKIITESLVRHFDHHVTGEDLEGTRVPPGGGRSILMYSRPTSISAFIWQYTSWLTELWFYVPLHKIGHFGDVPPTNLLAWYGKTKPNTTKAHSHQSKQMYHNTKQTQKTKQGLVASYDIWHGNGEGLILFARFINLSLNYLDLPTYLQHRDPHGVQLALCRTLTEGHC